MFSRSQCKWIVGALLASTTVACGPRISQWVQVTDCKQNHVVVPNARVYVYEGITPEMAGQAGSVGVIANGGRTDAQGNTWGSFPVERGSAVRAYVTENISTEQQPAAKVPANPLEPVRTCVNR